VVLLLQHGASPDAATHDLYTALHIAAKEGHEEVVRILLEHGANQTLMTNVCYLTYLFIYFILFVYSVIRPKLIMSLRIYSAVLSGDRGRDPH